MGVRERRSSTPGAGGRKLEDLGYVQKAARAGGVRKD
jgi:hypothetical protein